MIRIFRHYISGVYLGLTMLEFWVYFSSVFIGSWIRDGVAGGYSAELLVVALLFGVVMLVVTTCMGVYQRIKSRSRSGLLLRILLAFGLGFAAMSLFFYALPAYSLGRGAFILAILTALLAILLLRLVFYRLVSQQLLRRRVLVLGAGINAAKVLELENCKGGFEIDVVGCVPMSDDGAGVPADRILYPRVPLHDFVVFQDIDDIVVAPDDRRRGLPVDEILDCKMAGFPVLDLVTFFEREAGLIRVDSLHPSWFVFSDGFRIATGLFAKRILDVLVSLAMLVLVWPVMLLIAAAIWLESGGRGPVIYRQTRVGVNWSLITVYKFRSMRVDAEKGQPQMAAASDSRVTRVGSVIRKFRLDELPQLYNVLKGEMSFVGPRPERPEFVEKYVETIPYYSERHRVKPGITGWAQLCYPYGVTQEDAVAKLQYDLYYIKNYSLFLDFMIILQTIETVVWGKGAR